MHRNVTYPLIASVSLLAACAAPVDPLELDVSVENDEILRKAAHERFWFPPLSWFSSVSETELILVDEARRNFNFAWQFLDSIDPSTVDFWSLCPKRFEVFPLRVDYTIKDFHEKEIEEDIKGAIVPEGTSYRELARIYERNKYKFSRWRVQYRKACLLWKTVDFDQLLEVRAALSASGAELYIKNNRQDLTLSAHWIDWGIYVIGRETPIARGANQIEFIGGLAPGESIIEDWWDELSIYHRKIRQAVQDFGVNQLYMRACLTAQPGKRALEGSEPWPGCIIYQEELASVVLELARDLTWLIRLRKEVFNQPSQPVAPPTTKT